MKAESGRKNFIEMAKISSVFHPVGQGHIKAALFLAKREIAFTMDGEREDIRIVQKNFRGAVTLMNVKIDYGSATDEAALSQELNCHGNIIEYAKPCAFRTEGMVRSAAERGPPAVF